MAKSSHNHGFTLIELLIALAVMVAIATIAAPQFSRAMIYVELRKSTQEFAASLRNARNRSITEARTAEIIFDAEHQFLRVKEQGIVYEWPDDITVELIGSDASMPTQSWSVSFYPDGSATDAGFSVSALQRSYLVSVDWLTGRVRVL